ncbi:PAS domain-containing protein [Mycolicibacterium grossiae]|uniref:PAS domain-containing protein n=1 Tax=Mycolicibacterium grossiae TaxID=1552759 RepID=A0A1E8Q3F5_9MYCO|nr:PAS domain-containing protein [Mycolicibacterium grossiae]OFJ52947.1 hypothetical protein BEL07_15195 [Mycolicibacterium grossiae]QEM44706.1 hypothetical protein FZ046_07820 [Mycolicibacterium grossiae]
MTAEPRDALSALLAGMSPAAVLDRLAVPVLVVDGEVVGFANAAFAEMLGRQVLDLTGAALHSLLVGSSTVEPVPAGLMTWRHADGYPVRAKVSGHVSVPGADGVVMVAFTDVTEQAWEAD